MAEDLMYRLWKFLRVEHPDGEYNMKELVPLVKMSYPSVLKWSEVLIAKGALHVTDKGNNKLIRANLDVQYPL